MRSLAPLALCALFLASPALAGDVVVAQRDKHFSKSELKIRSGEKIVFRNEDSVVHNIYSLTPGFAFEIKTQMPGEIAEQKFEGKGVAEVRCAIHPQMKLTVKVDQ